MRTILIITMFTASLAYADWNDVRETRELELDAQNIGILEIESRSGSLEVTGDSESGRILVKAIIEVPDTSDEKAEKIIAKDLVLSLDQKGDTAVLKGYFDGGSWGWGDSPRVRLEVSVPSHLALSVNDTSGSIVVNEVKGNIEIDDSSGSIEMDDVGGTIEITDSSGSISVAGVGDSISIEDGSGSIKVRDVAGSVTIDDGSGSISVRNVDQDLIILGDGSGSVNYANIQGAVEER